MIRSLVLTELPWVKNIVQQPWVVLWQFLTPSLSYPLFWSNQCWQLPTMRTCGGVEGGLLATRAIFRTQWNLSKPKAAVFQFNWESATLQIYNKFTTVSVSSHQTAWRRPSLICQSAECHWSSEALLSQLLARMFPKSYTIESRNSRSVLLPLNNSWTCTCNDYFWYVPKVLIVYIINPRSTILLQIWLSNARCETWQATDHK